MDLEEIDYIYKAEIEKADKEFLEGIKNKVNVKQLELKHKEKLAKAKEKYEKQFIKILKDNKGKKSARKVAKSKKSSKFKVDDKRIGLSLVQRAKFRFKLLKFNLGVKA